MSLFHDVYHADSRELLKTLADNSIDAVVTDPPYALVSIVKRFGGANAAPAQAGGATGVYARASSGFMGRSWDTGETAFAPEFWGQVFRVLKPGGHVISFSATRTYHRMACAVEDAGFEIRDMVAWLYGSGFPKSKDAAKSVDGRDQADAARGRALVFTAWMRSAGVTAAQIDALTGSNMGGHYLTDAAQPAVATADMFDLLRPMLPPVPAVIEQLVADRTVESENMKARRVPGVHAQPSQANEWAAKFGDTKTAAPGLITEAFSAEAQAWEGWGTALKPALEPCVLARKPLEGTLAQNLLTWGVGALNIDGCRIDGPKTAAPVGRFRGSDVGATGLSGIRDGSSDHLGRWPANLAHDGSAEVEAVFPVASAGARRETKRSPDAGGCNALGAFAGQESVTIGYDEPEGSAARFFYSAKADAEDRMGSDHPTVKPVDLMAWLVRLICPPGGVVLDPFGGSGTTALAAMREGRSCVTIERDAGHAEDIRLRLAHARGEGGLTRQLMLRNDLAKDPLAAAGAGTPLFGGGGHSPGPGGGQLGFRESVRRGQCEGYPEGSQRRSRPEDPGPGR